MDIKDVENLADMAKIELSPEEQKEILKDMEGILEYVKVINTVELKDVQPEYELKNVWREDTKDSREFSKELIVEQFPDSRDGFLKVKKIL